MAAMRLLPLAGMNWPGSERQVALVFRQACWRSAPAPSTPTHGQSKPLQPRQRPSPALRLTPEKPATALRYLKATITAVGVKIAKSHNNHILLMVMSKIGRQFLKSLASQGHVGIRVDAKLVHVEEIVIVREEETSCRAAGSTW